MILDTQRLILREFELSDAHQFFELNNNPKILRYTGDEPFSSEEESKEFIHNYSAYSDFGYGRWAVVLQSSNMFIGWCGLKFHPQENYTDLGFRFFEEYWNQGFATESSRGVIKFAFKTLGLTKLVARVEQENAASVKVLYKLGFKQANAIKFNNTEGLLFELDRA